MSPTFSTPSIATSPTPLRNTTNPSHGRLPPPPYLYLYFIHSTCEATQFWSLLNGFDGRTLERRMCLLVLLSCPLRPNVYLKLLWMRLHSRLSNFSRQAGITSFCNSCSFISACRKVSVVQNLPGSSFLGARDTKVANTMPVNFTITRLGLTAVKGWFPAWSPANGARGPKS